RRASRWWVRQFHRHPRRQSLTLPCRRAVFQTFEIILSVIVVLINDGDPGVRLLLQNVLCIYSCLVLVVWNPADRPWEVPWVIPFRRTSLYKKLRHLLRVHISLDGGVGRGSEWTENQ